MIKVFVVDDHQVIIEGIYALLRDVTGIELMGSASNAAQCRQFFISNHADVILMDISMPEMDGIALCKLIKDAYPKIMVLALSTFDQGAYVQRMMDSGASGYILKSIAKQELITAIQLAAAGKTYLSRGACLSLKQETQKLRQMPRLTKREKEVLVHVVAGLTNNKIAETLYISVDTVDSHRKSLHLKLNVTNTASLVRYAIEHQLV